MGYSKLELVGAAFEEIGLPGYEFDLTSEEQASALRRADALAASWNSLGIRIGYALPSTPGGSDINAQSGITDDAYEAFYTALAIRMAPTFGKAVSNETRIAAKRSYDALLSRAMSDPPRVQLPGTMPAGAGNRRFRGTIRPFLTPPVTNIDAGPDAELEFR
mgnify:CR=1 FL=1